MELNISSDRIHSLQLRKMTGAPFYVSNYVIKSDLNVPFVNDLASIRYKYFHSNLIICTKPLVQDMSSPLVTLVVD